MYVLFTVDQVILALGDYLSVQCHACIGGTNVGEDIRKLDFGQHVVSGTPGRVFGTFKLSAPSLPYCRRRYEKLTPTVSLVLVLGSLPKKVTGDR